jgi:large subunit ribosomal protein L1
MARRSKRFQEIDKAVDTSQSYSLEEAVALLQGCPKVKFDQSVEVALQLGVDPRKADQQVRGNIALPHGTGRRSVILVLAKGDKVQEALDAGADFAGSDEFIDKIEKGWMDFTVMVATPDMMRDVGRLGKLLGPRGLMPSPKAGTVTQDVAGAVREIQGGKLEFKVNRGGAIYSAVGKLSFEANQLVENLTTYLGAIWRAKPASAKGNYFKSLYLSSTMGPGIQIDLRKLPMA